STSVTVFSNLVFQRIEETRFPVAGPIADALVVKYERAAVAGWPRGIKTIILIHRDVIRAGHLASPVVILANAVRVRGVKWLDQILAHQVSTVVRAAKALEGAVLQSDRLKFHKNCLAQLAASRAVCETDNHNSGGSCQSDNDESDADQ